MKDPLLANIAYILAVFERLIHIIFWYNSLAPIKWKFLTYSEVIFIGWVVVVLFLMKRVGKAYLIIKEEDNE